MDTFEDVELVIETTIVEFVEDLHPDESVEDHSVELFLTCAGSKDFIACKVEHECDDELVDRLACDHLPHVDGNEWC